MSIRSKNKIFTIVVVALVMLVSLLFCFYESYEAGHDCNHENECPICQVLQLCKNVKDGTIALNKAFITFFAFVFLLDNIKSFSQYLAENTLIDLKVRLND